MADNKVNFYDILKEMDSVDSNSIRAGIDVVRVNQGKKGTEVTIGIGGSYALGVESGKTIPVLLMMDSAAYKSAKQSVEKSEGVSDAERLNKLIYGPTFPMKLPGERELSVDVLVEENGEWIIGYYDFTGEEWVDKVNGTSIHNATGWHPLPPNSTPNDERSVATDGQ